MSLVSDNFPNILKVTKVIQIYKTGDKSLHSSYLQTSLVPILIKFLKAVSKSYLINFSLKKDYSPKNSMLSFLAFTHQKLYKPWLKMYKCVLKISLSLMTALTDLSKALDCISHELLLKVLEIHLKDTILYNIIDFSNLCCDHQI